MSRRAATASLTVSLTVTAAACAVLLAGCGSSSTPVAAPGVPAPTSAGPSETPSPTPTQATSAPASDPVVEIAVTVEGGAVTPAPANVPVPLGSDVLLTVTSDVADQIHVHGYDVEQQVKSGGTATLELTADQPGTFEVETHESELLLLKLVVS